jgi:serine/threonine protein kinase/ABC-type sugar transport system substrate-binding protein
MVSDPLIGSHIGEFEILERLGVGGMSVVYRAHQPSMHRDVALKVLSAEQSALDSSFRQRFEQEVAVIASLEHLHIMPVYSYGIDGDFVYLAMRLSRGGTLAELMQREKLSQERVLELFTQIAQGLAYAHSKGVVHRDLKPSNILLDDDGNTYLTDFGLAKILGKEADITHSGNVVGTPAYMSPEQLKGDTLDHRADIYGLGIILYQMLTNQRPFEGDSANVVSLIYKQLEQMPVSPSKVDPNITPEIDGIVIKALQKDPERRFSSVGEMAEALQEAVGRRSSKVFPEPATSLIRERARRSIQFSLAKPRNRLMAAMAVLLVMAAVVILLLALRPPPSSAIVALPTLTKTRIGTIADVVPSDEELTRAREIFTGRFIAIVPCNMSSQYHAVSTREMTDRARGYGIETRIYDADTDNYQQSILVEKARAEGATAFIVCPLNNEIMDPALRALDAANYPLVLPVSGSSEHYGGVAIETDNYLMGRVPGEFAGQWIRDAMDGKAKVAILDYPGLSDLVQRANGLEDGVLAFAPDAEILGRFLGATQEFAHESISGLLAEGVTPDVIVSINDAGTYGAITALEEADIPESDVAIFSIDAEPQARNYIRDGHYLKASGLLARTDYAYAAVDSIVRQVAGATMPETILLEPEELVTVDNLPTEEPS